MSRKKIARNGRAGGGKGAHGDRWSYIYIYIAGTVLVRGAELCLWVYPRVCCGGVSPAESWTIPFVFGVVCKNQCFGSLLFPPPFCLIFVVARRKLRMRGATGRSVYNSRFCQRWKSAPRREDRRADRGHLLCFLHKWSCGLKVCLKYSGHLANVLHASACFCTVCEYAGGCLSSF